MKYQSDFSEKFPFHLLKVMNTTLETGHDPSFRNNKKYCATSISMKAEKLKISIFARREKFQPKLIALPFIIPAKEILKLNKHQGAFVLLAYALRRSKLRTRTNSGDPEEFRGSENFRSEKIKISRAPFTPTMNIFSRVCD